MSPHIFTTVICDDKKMCNLSGSRCDERPSRCCCRCLGATRSPASLLHLHLFLISHHHHSFIFLYEHTAQRLVTMGTRLQSNKTCHYYIIHIIIIKIIKLFSASTEILTKRKVLTLKEKKVNYFFLLNQILQQVIFYFCFSDMKEKTIKAE